MSSFVSQFGTPKKVTIIGAGQIGRMLAEELLKQGYNVTLFNRDNSPNEQELQANINKIRTQLKDQRISQENFTFTRDIESIKGQHLIHYVIGEALGDLKDFAGPPESDRKGRAALLESHAQIAAPYIRALLPNNPSAVLVNISNPVDPMTHLMADIARSLGLSNLVIGMGSALDSSRLHTILEQFAKEKLRINNPKITGSLVLGEHGYGLVPILSMAKVNGQPILPKLTHAQVLEIRTMVQHRPWEIIREKRHTDVEGPVHELVEMTKALFGRKFTPMPYTGINYANNIYEGQMGIFSNGSVIAAPYVNKFSDLERQLLQEGRKNLSTEWESFKTKNKGSYPELSNVPQILRRLYVSKM